MFLELVGAGFVLVVLLHLILWLLAFYKDNMGFIDFGGSAGFLLIAWAGFFLGDGFFVKRLILIAMATVWAGRLLRLNWTRFEVTREDPKFALWRRPFGPGNDKFKTFLLFVLSAFTIIVVSLPFYLVDCCARAEWHVAEVFGIFLWGGGFAGAFFADKDLQEFRRNPQNAGKVCQTGWWKMSRHPNYFFEWLVWIGYFLYAYPTTGGWFALASPFIMLILFTRATGIPISEELALSSKGAAYREYQKTTSAFLPWPF